MRSRHHCLEKPIRIGISGWTYPRWRGLFYPKGLAHRQELQFASRHFNSIEINGTFYRLQKPSVFQSWYEQTPNDFVFSVKGSRFITHMKKLRDIEPALEKFFASGVLDLKEKLGPILWQLPPQLPFDLKRLEDFFEKLPLEFSEARDLIHEKEQICQSQRLRYAIEVRHETYRCQEFIDLLRKYRMALVIADTAGKWPYLEDLTSDFFYVRLHGHQEIYSGGYDKKALRWWARRIRFWRQGEQPPDHVALVESEASPHRSLEGFVYFDNDLKVHAPSDALHLVQELNRNQIVIHQEL